MCVCVCIIYKISVISVYDYVLYIFSQLDGKMDGNNVKGQTE